MCRQRPDEKLNLKVKLKTSHCRFNSRPPHRILQGGAASGRRAGKPAAPKFRLLPQIEHCRAASIEVHCKTVCRWWFETTSPLHDAGIVKLE
jgi:hypothetical protein